MEAQERHLRVIGRVTIFATLALLLGFAVTDHIEIAAEYRDAAVGEFVDPAITKTAMRYHQMMRRPASFLSRRHIDRVSTYSRGIPLNDYSFEFRTGSRTAKFFVHSSFPIGPGFSFRALSFSPGVGLYSGDRLLAEWDGQQLIPFADGVLVERQRNG